MGSRNTYQGIDEYAVKLVRHRARQLVGRAGFVDEDRHDLEQDLVFDLLRRLPRFDPSRGARQTFIARVIDNRVATLLEAQTAARRDYRLKTRWVDVDLPPEDEEPDAPQGSPVLAQNLRQQHTGPQSRCDRGELRRDLEVALGALPAAQRDLCRRLLTQTVSEISRDTGIPRATLYGALQQVRRAFEKANLGAYVGRGPDTSRSGPVGKL